MDIIHADAERVEIGFVDDFSKFDMQISTTPDIDSNSFALSLSERAWEEQPIREGHLIYIPFTEWGGPVEHIKHSTKTGLLTISGPTWRGMLARKVISPPPGAAYLIINDMEANAAVAYIMGDTFGDYFHFSPAASGVSLSGSWRYDTLLTGLQKAVTASTARLVFAYDNASKYPVISVQPAANYSALVDLSQDYGVHITSERGGMKAYNHVIALGSGELTEREIIHAYRLANGTITTTPPASRGAADLVTVYDYSNAESSEELLKGAIKRLEECKPSSGVELDISETELILELGDIVGARDRLTGLSTTATVAEKILIIDSNGQKIQMKVG